MIKWLHLEDCAKCVVLKGATRYVDVESQECSDMDDVKEHGSVGGCKHESVGSYG